MLLTILGTPRREVVFDHLHGFPEPPISGDFRGDSVTSPCPPTYGDA